MELAKKEDSEVIPCGAVRDAEALNVNEHEVILSKVINSQSSLFKQHTHAHTLTFTTRHENTWTPKMVKA